MNCSKLASCYRQINMFSFANCCAMFAFTMSNGAPIGPVRTWPDISVSPKLLFAINTPFILRTALLLGCPIVHTSNLLTIGWFYWISPFTTTYLQLQMKYECKILLDIYMTHETIWQILCQLEICARLPKSHWRSLDLVWILNKKKNTVGFTDLNPMP